MTSRERVINSVLADVVCGGREKWTFSPKSILGDRSYDVTRKLRASGGLKEQRRNNEHVTLTREKERERKEG